MIYQPGVTIEQVEREMILSAMRFHRGNMTLAADSLGISRRTIYNKIKKYRDQGIKVLLSPAEESSISEAKGA